MSGLTCRANWAASVSANISNCRRPRSHAEIARQHRGRANPSAIVLMPKVGPEPLVAIVCGLLFRRGPRQGNDVPASQETSVGPAVSA
jgi:hypothetical protein